MTNVDFTVTSAEVSHLNGKPFEIKTRHNRIESGCGFVQFRRNDGMEIVRFSPIRGSGKAIVRSSDADGHFLKGLFNTNEVMMCDAELTFELLATARKYVADNYDVDTGRAIWIDNGRVDE